MKLRFEILVLQFLVFLKLCSTTTTTTKRFSKCMEYSANVDCDMHLLSETPMIGNRIKALSDYPHIGLISFKRDLSESMKLVFGTQGSLISTRYVISYARIFNNTWEIGGPLLIPYAVEFLTLPTEEKSDPSILYTIEKAILHPDYIEPSIKNDIALIKLTEKVELSEFLRPICLPNVDIMPDVVYRVNMYDIRGRQILKFRTQPVLINVCNTLYKINSHELIDDKFICTIAMDFGDPYYTPSFSGCPITVDYPDEPCSRVLLGIAVPTIDVRVADAALKVINYVDWIEETIWGDGEED